MKQNEETKDNEEDHLIAFWTRGEKKRTMLVVQRIEERIVLWQAIKTTSKIVASIVTFLVAFKLAGLGMYWSQFVTWMAQK